jgi:signal transduction histidine kinase/ligand-binding sensor protein
MPNILCPKCNHLFSVNESITHALCPNPDCTAIVHFEIFANRQLADEFTIEHQTEYHTLIKQLTKQEKWIISYYKEQITRYITPPLSKLIPEEILQSIQAGYADYLGGPLTLFEVFDEDENRRVEPLARRNGPKGDLSIQESKFRNFTEFCKVLRTYEKNGIFPGDLGCRRMDLNKVNEEVASGKSEALSHICWCGFIEFTAPIIVNDKILGVIFSGQKRHKDPNRQTTMKELINNASKQMGLDEVKMISLAFSNDVEEVDDNDIEIMKAELKRIASELQTFAINEYRSQREARERDFFDSIDSVFTEAIDTINPDPLSISSIFETVLKGIRLFTSFPLAGLFLTPEDQPESLQYIAGNFMNLDSQKKPIFVKTDKNIMTTVRGTQPLVGNNAVNKFLPISQQLEDIFPEFQDKNVVTYCVVPITYLKSKGVLLLAYSIKNQNALLDTHYIETELGTRFLKNLGHIIGEHLGLCHDIAEIKQEQANVRHLIISLGHEVNTPIQSMLADVANIVDELPDQSEIRGIAEHSLEEINRLHLLSENIIGVLSNRKKPKTQFSNHSIFRPINDACEMFLGEAAAKGCNIIGPRSIGSQFPKMEMSLFDLTLAFKNLIHNAVKYSFYPPKGMEGERFIKVIGYWINNDEESQKYAIDIINYGIGIKPEEISKGKIFEPFYRSDWATDRNRTGSGLGLTLAKRVIVDMHAGEIQVQSTQMPGTAYLNKFTVILPISQNK